MKLKQSYLKNKTGNVYFYCFKEKHTLILIVIINKLKQFY